MKPETLGLTLVVAVARNGCIGKAGGLPWHFPEDLKHFKRVTTGHAVIMGRKTYDSIGRPLPDRRNIVVTRNPNLRIEGCETTPDLASAIRMAREGGDAEPRVIGGSSLFAEALPMATKLFLTEIDEDVEGDTYFPQWDRSAWVEEQRTAGADPRVSFVTLRRKSNP